MLVVISISKMNVVEGESMLMGYLKNRQRYVRTSRMAGAVKQLIDKYGNVNEVYKGQTVLSMLVDSSLRCNDDLLEVFQLLINAGADVNFGSPSAAYVFTSKYRCGIREIKNSIIRLLLDGSNTDPEYLVVQAERNGHPLSALIEVGATCNFLDNPIVQIYERDGSAALVRAIENGCRVNYCPDNRMTTLMYAVTLDIDASEIVHAILRNSVNPFVRDECGKTALIIGIERSTHFNSFRPLIPLGLDKNGDALVAMLKRAILEYRDDALFTLEEILRFSTPDYSHCKLIKEILDFFMASSAHLKSRRVFLQRIAEMMKPVAPRFGWTQLKQKLVQRSIVQYWKYTTPGMMHEIEDSMKWGIAYLKSIGIPRNDINKCNIVFRPHVVSLYRCVRCNEENIIFT